MTPDSRRIDVVLPAGGRISGEFARASGAEIKALVTFNGNTILQQSICALKALPNIGRIVVVGPEAAQRHGLYAGADAALNELETGSANILRGVEWLQLQSGCADHTVIMTTDMPFITTEGIQGFLALCPEDKDICVPVVERAEFERVYKDLIRTDTRLADGWFRLGGLFVLNPSTLLRNRAHLDMVFAARKSNIKMAQMVGLRTAFRYLARTLRSEDIVRRACQILRCSGAVIKNAPPEIAFDIDLLEEYEYAVQRWNAGVFCGKDGSI